MKILDRYLKGKVNKITNIVVNEIFLKGIWQYIFLLFHFKELLKLYVKLFYRFCVTLLFIEIF